MFYTVDNELAVVLVRQVECLGKTAADTVDICADRGEALGESRLNSEGTILSRFKTFVIGLAFWVFEDLGFEECIVGVGGLVEGLGPLRMEFEGVLEEFEGIVDLRNALEPTKTTISTQAYHTWRSFVVSTSSSMFSSGSTLMAEKAAYRSNQLAAMKKGRWVESIITILSRAVKVSYSSVVVEECESQHWSGQCYNFSKFSRLIQFNPHPSRTGAGDATAKPKPSLVV